MNFDNKNYEKVSEIEVRQFLNKHPTLQHIHTENGLHCYGYDKINIIAIYNYLDYEWHINV
jgi:hypothetical protein